MTKLPVLDSHNRDANIIGWAASDAEASAILAAHFATFSSDDEILEHKKNGLFIMNKRVGFEADQYDIAEELANGFYDNA